MFTNLGRSRRNDPTSTGSHNRETDHDGNLVPRTSPLAPGAKRGPGKEVDPDGSNYNVQWYTTMDGSVIFNYRIETSGVTGRSMLFPTNFAEDAREKDQTLLTKGKGGGRERGREGREREREGGREKDNQDGEWENGNSPREIASPPGACCRLFSPSRILTGLKECNILTASL